MHLISKIDRALAKLEEVLLALLLVGMVLLAATQVLLRNIWNTAIDWADISLQNVTLVVGLLGAAIATSEGRHLNIDVFSRLFTGRKKCVLRVVIGIFAVVVCWYLTRGGWTTFQKTYQGWLLNVPSGWAPSRLLWQELSEGTFAAWVPQLPLFGGFALIGFHFLLRLVRDVGWLVTGEPWETTAAGGAEGDEALDELERMAADADDDEDDEDDEDGRPSGGEPPSEDAGR